jgi:hypothetical protein
VKLVAPVPPLAAGNVPVTLLAKFNDWFGPNLVNAIILQHYSVCLLLG